MKSLICFFWWLERCALEWLLVRFLRAVLGWGWGSSGLTRESFIDLLALPNSCLFRENPGGKIWLSHVLNRDSLWASVEQMFCFRSSAFGINKLAAQHAFA